jgi:hypothetical protein
MWLLRRQVGHRRAKTGNLGAVSVEVGKELEAAVKPYNGVGGLLGAEHRREPRSP